MTTHALMAALLLAQAAPTTPTPPGPAATPPGGAAPEASAPAPAPGAPAPAGASSSPATPPVEAGALTLDQALQEAVARNPDLQVLAERVRQSRELSWRAWSSYLPRVVAGGTFTHNDFSDVTLTYPDPTTGVLTTAILQKQNQLAAQVRADQALLAPQAWYGIASAGAAERVAASQVEASRRDVLFGVVQVFYGAAGARQALAVSQRLLALNLEREKDARVRYQAGTTPKVSLLRAEIDRAGAEQDLKRAQNAYASSRVALAALLSRPNADFEVALPPPPPVPGDAATLEARALELRPDVLAAREQVSLAERNRNGVLTRYAPALGAFAQWQWANLAGFTGKESTWAVGLAATWTLLDGGLRESDFRDAQSKTVEAEAALRSAENRALDEVRRARLDLDSAVANRAKSQERVELARENWKLVDVNFRAGAATYLEVSDAATQLTSAEVQLVSDSINADLSAIRLLKVAGLWRDGK